MQWTYQRPPPPGRAPCVVQVTVPVPWMCWQSVYTRFAKWRDEGTLKAIFRALSEDADMENLSLDFTCVKVRKSANGGGKRRIRRTFSTNTAQTDVLKRIKPPCACHHPARHPCPWANINHDLQLIKPLHAGPDIFYVGFCSILRLFE